MWVRPLASDDHLIEVQPTAYQVDHGLEILSVTESSGTSLDLLDDTVDTFEHCVCVLIVEVVHDVIPVASH